MSYDFKNHPWFLQQEHKERVWCPHCGAEYDLDPCEDSISRKLTIPYTTDDPVEVKCENEGCEKTYWVTAHVRRTFVSTFKNTWSCESDGKAKFKG